ncbi:MAG: peptide chain release factor 2 [Actinobacteria bacterium]|jgi:peptide chain release factor 2|nr:peptide chain release factor 2 [Actinomycetota bacterium]MBT3746981.1 peptide chain release factor 2 [Actinomycetota bacterium]MBT3970533.1 peptide chain release factor 2 [Actinomycetota bacterium]MBT4010393.1 peptide chain release factor 2 [Actinomycetota bacterium]MBT4302790.1 peptide chain release factor 2 [Actinomycetota bacterium]
MEDFTEPLGALRVRLNEADKYLHIGEQNESRQTLEAEMADPDLWNDQNRGRQVQKDLAAVVEDLDLFASLSEAIEEAETLALMASEEEDASLDEEIKTTVADLQERFSALELRSLFSGEYDESDAVCHIQSGAGGTDAQDWAEMLLRMYSRWAEKRGFSIELESYSEGTEAGLSSVEFIVRGRHAFGLLQGERGVHRLVRISPFNKESKRQTAFASLYVVPFFEAVTDQVEIDEGDLRIDTFRASGAGGQHINVTDSAVRITHLPTGVVTSCQNERSQHQNKDRAMQMLAAKLLDLERQKRNEEMAALGGEQRNVDFGSQIRSYVLHPYQMVKDLRTEHEIGDVEGVLDGNLDGFMESYLRWARAAN